MPRAPWRRRRTTTTDSPRPGGRRWTGRLRRGGVFARQVLRVRHRRRTGGTLAVEAYPYPPQSTHLDPRPVPKISQSDADRQVWSGAHPSLLPGDRTLARQVSFALVTCCTVASLSLGVLAILLAMRGDVQTAALCLVACVALDGMDGTLARRLGVSSPFGAQMDSLADMCAFGIAAPVVVYASLAGSVPTPAAAVSCALVAACAALRLARFNISPKDGNFFTGVPTTLAAAVLVVAVLIDLPVPPTALLLGVAVLAFAMVSSFPYAKLARLLRLPPWLWMAPLAGVMVDARLTFVALVVAYLGSGPVVWLRHRRTA